ncbi:hypothetical protein OH460_07720 [Vibrio sp. Makdt]|uniref:hypothetical protein n=1 Tax=Vibrio sp. Makdt TaxID=2998828 RepID=UPI0022CD9250|nr:hypothetical protein [Vibrio sp. Makdt]MDA0152184.1 hypothetical protein [Vibrio sp. Makdt]
MNQKQQILDAITDKLMDHKFDPSEHKETISKIRSWECRREETKHFDTYSLIASILALIVAYFTADYPIEIFFYLLPWDRHPDFGLSWLASFLFVAAILCQLIRVIVDTIRFKGLSEPSFDEVQLGKSKNIGMWITGLHEGSFLYGLNILNVIDNPLIFAKLHTREKVKSALYFTLCELGDAEQCYELALRAKGLDLENEYYVALQAAQSKGSYKAAKDLSNISTPIAGSSGLMLAGAALSINTLNAESID